MSRSVINFFLNFYIPGRKTIHFDSHEISKADASCDLVHLDEKPGNRNTPDHDDLMTLAQQLQNTFHLDLFGIDVIVDKISGKIGVIDINAFPGKIDRNRTFLEDFQYICNRRISSNSLI